MRFINCYAGRFALTESIIGYLVGSIKRRRTMLVRELAAFANFAIQVARFLAHPTQASKPWVRYTRSSSFLQDRAALPTSPCCERKAPASMPRKPPTVRLPDPN
jgi:hypothetical protein